MADVPTLSRRHAAGAESARGLLFTVLGEFVLPAGGSVWTSTMIDVLSRLGVEEKATRQALMRTAADGWLRSERSGRRTQWWLTEAASQLLVEGTARIFGFRAGMGDWDGQWLLVLARVPESERPMRHRLRTRLAWAGLGNPSPGVWLSPHTERLDEVRGLLDEAGVLSDAQLFTAVHTGIGEAGALVAQAWDLAELAAGYQEFVDEFAAEAREPDAVTRTIELVHAWRRFPGTDPALPRELLPSQWTGEAAAELFRRRHEQWAGPARVEWRALDA